MERELTDYLFVFSIHAFPGLLFIVFGYLIKVKRKGNLINFYKESNYKDSNKYLDCIGKRLFLSGSTLTVLAFSVFVVRLQEWLHAGILVGIVASIVGGCFYCEKRFRV